MGKLYTVNKNNWELTVAQIMVNWLTGQPPGVPQPLGPSSAEFKCCGKSRSLWSDPDR